MNNNEPTRDQKLDDAIAIIEWLRAHPNVPLPQELESGGLWTIVLLNGKDEALQLVREFGHCTKKWSDAFLHIEKKFGHLRLSGLFWRKSICERVVIGTDVVIGTEEVSEQITPATTREIVEWKCHPLLQGENEHT